LLKEASKNGSSKGICIGPACDTLDVLFVDDILIFCERYQRIVCQEMRYTSTINLEEKKKNLIKNVNKK
jgi:hypothetical protein